MLQPNTTRANLNKPSRGLVLWTITRERNEWGERWMDTIICLFVNSLVRNFIVLLPVISYFFQPPRHWDEWREGSWVGFAWHCVYLVPWSSSLQLLQGRVVGGVEFRWGEGNMLRVGQTSDISSVSWWGCGGAGTMGGQRAPNCCILPRHPLPCNPVQCCAMPCNAVQCESVQVQLHCIALQHRSLGPTSQWSGTQPFDAHGRPPTPPRGAICLCPIPPTNIMIPQMPWKFLK